MFSRPRDAVLLRRARTELGPGGRFRRCTRTFRGAGSRRGNRRSRTWRSDSGAQRKGSHPPPFFLPVASAACAADRGILVSTVARARLNLNESHVQGPPREGDVRGAQVPRSGVAARHPRHRRAPGGGGPLPGGRPRPAARPGQVSPGAESGAASQALAVPGSIRERAGARDTPGGHHQRTKSRRRLNEAPGVLAGQGAGAGACSRRRPVEAPAERGGVLRELGRSTVRLKCCWTDLCWRRGLIASGSI